jgi:hypothetical protein
LERNLLPGSVLERAEKEQGSSDGIIVSVWAFAGFRSVSLRPHTVSFALELASFEEECHEIRTPHIARPP